MCWHEERSFYCSPLTWKKTILIQCVAIFTECLWERPCVGYLKHSDKLISPLPLNRRHVKKFIKGSRKEIRLCWLQLWARRCTGGTEPLEKGLTISALFFFFKCDMFSVVKEESITVMITSFIIRRCQLFHPSYSQISSQRAFWLLKMLLLWAKFCSSHWDILSYLRLEAHSEKQVTEAWKGKWRSFSALRRAMNRSEQGDVTETHVWEWGDVH